MQPFDPYSFGQPPPDAILDDEALTLAYEPQLDAPFLEDNLDLPPSDVDPRGLARDQGMLGASLDPQSASDMGSGNEIGAGESLEGMDMVEDPEALQQALLDAQSQYNSSSLAYQDAGVAANEEEGVQARKIEEGLA